VGIFTRTFERAFGQSPHSDIGEEGSLNRRLCQSYSIEIRGHRGRRRDVSRVSWHSTWRSMRRKDLGNTHFPCAFFDLSLIPRDNNSIAYRFCVRHRDNKIDANIDRKYPRRIRHRSVNESYQAQMQSRSPSRPTTQTNVTLLQRMPCDGNDRQISQCVPLAFLS